MLRRACLLLVLLSGCSSESSSASRPDADEPLLTDAGPCGVTTGSFPPASANHVDEGTKLTFVSNPPCGGDHFGLWATWGAHETAVPRGNWIHNLEHGGVVLLYRCASRAACPELAAKLEALAQSLPADPACVAPVRNRVVVTADPDLPAGVQVAAASWGYNLVARCFDESALRDFYTRRFGRGSESTCAQGFTTSSPSDGGMDASSDAASD